MIYLEAIYRIGSNLLGEKSAIEPVLFGVPQGSVLGPLLFLLYINYIVNCFTDNDIKLALYADDTNIFITGDSRHNLIEKQTMY